MSGMRVGSLGKAMERKHAAQEGKGICPSCDKLVPLEQLEPAPDPYLHEIHDDDTPVMMCEDCRYERAMDI